MTAKQDIILAISVIIVAALVSYLINKNQTEELIKRLKQ